MKKSMRIAAVFAAACSSWAQQPTPATQPAPAVAGQELSTQAKSKELAEARAKRNALAFENNATIITFVDRYGKQTGKVGEKAMYDETSLSPDGKHIAVVKEDLPNESADLFILDVETGASTRLTTSARTEFVMGPVWSPDSKRVAYVTIRKGQESIYLRSANGQGAEEQVYQNPGAFLNLSDWSADGKFLAYAKSDLKGGNLYFLPLADKEHKPVEVLHSDLRLFQPKFSPDGRYLSYIVIDTSNKAEGFVRPVNAPADAKAVQISDAVSSPVFWRRDGKTIYFMARNQSVMAAEVSTSPSFTFKQPEVFYKQQGAVPDRITYISADGDRLVVLPRPRGKQLQQITIFNREGQVLQKVGEPDMYSSPSFSPDGTRLLVSKNDRDKGQADLWVIDIATGKSTQITNETFPKFNPLWSPDGRRIYYTSLRNDGNFRVYRRPADGIGNEETLFQYTPGAGLALSDIAPDEKSLICESGGVILTVPLTGIDPDKRTAIESLREEFDDTAGRLSPDGKFLLFRSDEKQAERFEVYVRPIDLSTGKVAQSKVQVSKDGAQVMLHWRNDGKEVFFRGMDLDSNDLRVMSADISTTPTLHAETPKLLFKLPGPLGGNLGNISRDGQRFVFAVNVPAASKATN
jgi:Tol biopolymer transport system component